MSDSSSGKAPTPTSPAPAGPPQISSGAVDPVLPESVVAQILQAHGLPRAKAGPVVQQITMEVQHRLHSGPLPTVEDFNGYNQVCPGAARDILDMAIRQQKHINFIEKLGAIADFLLPALALLAAVVIIGAMIWAGVHLAMNGHEYFATAMISGTGIATVVGAFLQGRKPKKPVAGTDTSQPIGKKKKGKGK